MSAVHRRWFLGAAATGLVGLAGCNLGTLTYFLTPEQRIPAKLKALANKDKKKAPTLVLLTHHATDIDTDLYHADREVAEQLARHLKLLAAAYKETVEIIPQRRVEDYKNSHPSWKSKPLTDVGEHFKADHVIYLEFLTLTTRDPKSIDMFSGKTTINVQLYETATPDEPPSTQTFTYNYPDDARGGIPRDSDMHPEQFRRTFLEKIAKKLVPYFADYPREELYRMD